METYIENLLFQLTLEEKISMIHGAGLFRTAPVERLGIPALHFSDGPMGVRGEYPDALWEYKNLTDDYVTYLPCNSALASTWNPELAFAMGSVLGEEARGRGKDMILAPGINIKRSPLCGRNFEYMSEDPYLIGQLAAPFVKGVQQHDVSACVKHFAANVQETDRLWVDTIADEKTLNEIYFPGFKAAVDAGCYGVMGAYNLLNGEHCCTSKSLLDEVLRKQWGFDGLVVSDWGGIHDTDLAANSSVDVEMDVRYDFENHFLADALLEKVRSGEISETLVDAKIRNILRLMVRLKMIGPEAESRSAGAYNTPQHRADALAVARESVALLKNEDKQLPLNRKKVKKLAVIGANAIKAHALGGGSAEIRALYEITPLMGIKKHLGGNVQVCYAPGYHVPDNGGRSEISWQANSTVSQPGCSPEPLLHTPEEIRKALLDGAVALAKDADAVIFVGGLDHMHDVEGLDRKNMRLPYGQDALIEALLSVRPDTVLALYAGSPVEMPWLPKAKTLLWSYYNGMEGGTALADILFGAVNPSGKLAETFPGRAENCNAPIAWEGPVVFSEGSMVGYRYYDRENIPVNFPFGHGLSYTRFAYSDLQIEGREVTFVLTNTGTVPGKETVQLYIHNGRFHCLRHFAKISLQPGESKTASFTMTDRDFSEYDVNIHEFSLASGEYTIQIGASSRDIRLCRTIKI